MGVHVCGRCLQPRQNAESGLHASSFRINRGRSVSKRPKIGVWTTKFPQKRSRIKPNSPAQAIERANSSRQPSFFPHPVRVAQFRRARSLAALRVFSSTYKKSSLTYARYVVPCCTPPENIYFIVAHYYKSIPVIMTMRITNLNRGTVLAEAAQIAHTSAARRRGLLGRKCLVAGEALWIVPCEAVHTFGMQFRIDVVFLSADKRVLKIRDSMPPWRLAGCFRACSVLELPSGTAAAADTKPGDRLEICAPEA
ncbi:MAG: DUF192 domain-containing protein [Bryobacteraceae bacterium]